MPNLTCEEPTLEGLYRLLRDGSGSAGLFTDEGGTFLGGHAMRQESHVSTISGLSKLWDGNPVDRIRGVDGITTFKGKRLSSHLMLQPEIAHGFIHNKTNKGQGILARYLMVKPETTMGTRLHRDITPQTELGLAAYEAHLLQCLEKPLPYAPGYRNELNPDTLMLAAKAKEALRVDWPLR